MLTVLTHDDVTELRFSTWRSRLSRMRVSAFVTRGTLFDSGFPVATPALTQWLRRHPVQAAALTHHHEDHAGGACALAALAVPLWIPDAARALVTAPPRVLFYRRFSWGSPAPLGPYIAAALPLGIEAIPTPGHTADHHIFWDAGTGTVFGGDLFIGVKVRIAHASEDPRATSASLRRIVALAPRRFFDAHRGLLCNPAALLTAKADWIDAMVDRVEQLAAQGLSDADIARRVLGSDRLGRWYTAGDYTMENWVRGVRRHR
ncbi:MAG: MBL fold metallo-hydrolase [Gemmatimonadota bacterium]|nr:MBL fold metallo-hydrolase [Gemmatimonadota bacterium]